MIDQLKYPGIFERESALPEAHEGTFEWIFDEIPKFSPFPNFLDWLQRGNGVFWINGKAGSGKSTLMNFISHRKETRVELERWAGQRRLIMPKFYLWRAGTQAEQHNLNGVIRSLLFQLLCIRPDVLASGLPYLYPKLMSFDRPRVTQPLIWLNTGRLYDALDAIICRLLEEYKICFLIDGLDEFYDENDDHDSLLQFMTKLVFRPNAKALVSMGNCSIELS